MGVDEKPRRVPRIGIVTAAQIGSNPRVVKEAQALHEAGLDVTVVAIRTLDRTEPRDQSILRNASWSCQRIDLRSRRRRLPARLLQLGARTAARWMSWPPLCDLAFSEFTPRLAMAAVRAPADLYIAHYPAALPAAAYAARRHGARYAFDAEDFHPGDLPSEARYDRERCLLAAIEHRHLPHCAYVTAASPGIADAYARAYDIAPPRVVLNTFPLTQAPALATPRGSAVPGPSVYWFSQTIGPDRGLECAVRAIGMARTRPHLYLRGTPANGFAEVLQRISCEVGAADRLHFLAPEDPNRMEQLAAQYDIGLVAETENTPNHRIALANKIFSYLLAGVPPVMSDTAAHRAFANDTRLEAHLYSVNDAVGLAARIDALLDDPMRLAVARASAFRLGRERYHWEIDSRVLLGAVRELLDTSLSGRERHTLPLSGRA